MIIRFIFFCIFIFTFKIFASDCWETKMPSDDEWNEWGFNNKIQAVDIGISKEVVEQNLKNIKPQSKIIMRDRCQPESTITLDEYLYYRVDKSRIIAGKNMLQDHKELLNKISEHFNIQPRFIVAILGMESYYGRNQGKLIQL